VEAARLSVRGARYDRKFSTVNSTSTAATPAQVPKNVKKTQSRTLLLYAGDSWWSNCEKSISADKLTDTSGCTVKLMLHGELKSEQISHVHFERFREST
jgi:hypothetical protein